MRSNKLLLDLALKYPFRILLNILLGFSGAFFNGVSTTLIVPIFLSLLGLEAILKNGPPVIQYLLSPFNRLPDDYRLIVMAVTIIFFIILKNLTSYLSSLASSSLSRALTAELQEKGLQLLLEVDLDYFSQTKVGDLVNRLGGEMSRTTASINSYVSLLTVSINIFVFVVLLLALSWQLTIIALLLAPLSSLITQHLVTESKRFGKVITDINHDYSSGLIELLSGIRLVKATGNESHELQRFEKMIRKREVVDFQAKMSSAAIGPLSEVSSIIALFVLVLLARYLLLDQISNTPNPSATLLPFLVLLFRLLPIVSQINTYRSNLARSAASIEVVNDLLRRDNKTFMPNGTLTFSGIRQGITFEHITFSYPTSSDTALQDINLYIPRGTTLALVGSSGAGKSTLADLLPRFYDPTAGRIMIDRNDIRDFDLKSIRQCMGIVSQDTFLFNDSVRNNIAYGFPNVTEEQLMDAIKKANAYEFIVRLPKGLDTQIGDRGVMLSGGQRQRIAIARALLKNPEILILDEATSALDTVSEHLVQQALDSLSQERTTLVIAHRLSTIKRADQIAVMERGRVVEVGTHEELLKKNGHYNKLHAMQFTESSTEKLSTLEDQRHVFIQASYEFRARLNAMLGSLGLLSDGLAETEVERDELVGEAYRSAIELFKTVRLLEAATSSSPNDSSQALQPPKELEVNSN